jgi:hypothetical protein
MLALAAVVQASGAAAQDGLFYVVEDERVVFTNLGAEEGAVPLPGFAGTKPRPAGAAPGRPRTLPGTIYDPYIENVAAEFDLSPELIKAVAAVESGFDPHARSAKGAQGLMQLMPETARHYGVRDAYDPLENLRAGSRHLRVLLDEWEGDVTLALAAYNAGSGAVRRHGGVPAYRETVDYVRKVQERLDPGRHPAPAAPRVEPPPADVRLVPQADGRLLVAN